MEISIFEIIGPVMIGPSSSHTAGMARIGLMAHEIIGLEPASIRLTLHPALRQTYIGHRTDVALAGGLLGIEESDERIHGAKQMLRERNIPLDVDFWEDISINPNTVRIAVTDSSGAVQSVTGISLGGGSLVITGVDDFALSISASEHQLLVWADADAAGAVEQAAGVSTQGSQAGGKWLYLLQLEQAPGQSLLDAVGAVEGVTAARYVAPVLSYGFVPGAKPLFTSYEELLKLCKAQNKTIPELAVDYEINRSGFGRAEILARMQGCLDVMKEACRKGLEEDIQLNYGLLPGTDGKAMLRASREGKALSGELVSESIARALAVMEVNGSMGCVVAAPTAGSCGIVPGCFVTMQALRGYSDEQIVDALLTAAAMGVVMYYRGSSFSGVVGGCQAEVGVSGAIAAAGLAFLGGGSGEACVHAAAMAIKNMLGLICDPIAGPVEVPCIKRNAGGVAIAYSSADMALAGIRSYVPPDEVIDALVNVQQTLPPALKGTTTGGLACTKTACALRDKLAAQAQG